MNQDSGPFNKQIINLPLINGRRMFNTLRPRHNVHHFADDTLKPIFVNENIRILIEISLKFVPEVPSHYLNQWWSVYWRIYASLGLNELPIIASLYSSVNIFIRSFDWLRLKLILSVFVGCFKTQHCFAKKNSNIDEINSFVIDRVWQFFRVV